MQDAETGSSAQSERQKQETGHAFGDGECRAGGMFSDLATLFAAMGASVLDTARLLGLETRLVVKTVIMMMVLGVVLGAVVVGIWLSMTLIVAAGLYEFAGLGLTLSIVVASLVNVICGGVLFIVLKRLIRRLAFPETRLAVRTLLDDASRTMQKQE